MRKLGFLLGVVLASATLLSLAGSVGAQSSCGLELSEADGNPSTEGFEVDEQRSFTFVVANPNDGTNAEGTFRVLQSPPPSWSWNTQEQTVRVAGGETQEVSIAILYLGERELDAEFSVRVEDVQCDVGGIGTPQSGGQTQTVSLALTHAPLPTDAGDEGLPLAWIVFGVIVAGAVIGVPVVYRSRSTRIAASCEESEKDVIAGRGTSFPITLKNKGSDPVPVKLEVSDVQEGWSALTTLPDLELGSKETRTVYMMVRAPPDAKPGDLCVAKLQVKPEGGSAQEVKTLARVNKAEEEAEPDEEAEPGEDDEADDEA